MDLPKIHKSACVSASPNFSLFRRKNVEFGFGGFDFCRWLVSFILPESFCSRPFSLSQFANIESSWLCLRDSERDVGRTTSHADRICVRLAKGTARRRLGPFIWGPWILLLHSQIWFGLNQRQFQAKRVEATYKRPWKPVISLARQPPRRVLVCRHHICARMFIHPTLCLSCLCDFRQEACHFDQFWWVEFLCYRSWKNTLRYLKYISTKD